MAERFINDGALVDQSFAAAQSSLIDGTPARFAMLISMIALSLFFGAYSSR